MADNITLNTGSGGSVLKTDDDGVAHWQEVKVAFGADGTQTRVDASNPLPVEGADAENAAITANPLPVGGRYDASPRTLGAGDVGAIALDADGAVHVSDGGNTLTVDGTVTANLSATDNAVLDQIDSNTDYGTVTGGGVEASALRVTLANDSTGVVTVDDGGGSLTIDGTVTANLSATDNAVLDNIDSDTTAILADTAAMDTNLGTLAGAVTGTEMQVDVVAALPAGTNAIGKLAANSGVDIGDVDVTSIAAGTNLIGDVGLGVRTSGGTSIYYDNDLDETAVAVKASAGNLYAIHVINTTAAPIYLQLFNVAQGSVTVGTTTPTVQFVVPGESNSDGAGFTFAVPQGISFSTAITAAASTDSEGNGAPAANACHCNLFYA